jgi:hypothetical protein
MSAPLCLDCIHSRRYTPGGQVADITALGMVRDETKFHAKIANHASGEMGSVFSVTVQLGACVDNHVGTRPSNQPDLHEHKSGYDE